ncbi:hypothetical protein KGY79_13825 [Candidatus Bipolaricaulota bacterium]|nr:hypothetical protein [Candidatus Bipolaricaulota bacterium]
MYSDTLEKSAVNFNTFLLTSLMFGLLLSGFTQYGLAQDVEGRLLLRPTEEFQMMMEENPEMARERFEEGLRITYEGDKPIRVRLYSAVIADGEIVRQNLSERRVGLEPEASLNLADAGEEFFPGSQWVPGESRWIPSSNWSPNPEMFSEGFRFHSDIYEENGKFIPEPLVGSLLAASDRASPLLYLVAVPVREFSWEVSTMPLVVGGPEAQIPETNCIPGSNWVPGSQ